jgi:hypothetical protein
MVNNVTRLTVELKLPLWLAPSQKFELRCYKSVENRVVKIILRVEESTGMVYNVTRLTVELKPPLWLPPSREVRVTML